MIIPRALSAKDFDKLLKAIQKLAGFSPENEHQVALIPKITARFYSAKQKVEFYLAGYEDLLTKNQAIKWVEAHKLDAVIVHKSNGEIYLRSRPGYHFDQIRFSQDDADVYMTSQDEKAIKAYWKERQKYYDDKLHGLRNVTVLDEDRSGTFEHAFINPIYQNVLKKIIHGYQHGK
jgi:hypothetical protein